MLYLSPPKSSECREDATCDQLSGLSLVSKPDPEINSHLIVKNAPSHALQAFKLLSTSTEAQVNDWPSSGSLNPWQPVPSEVDSTILCLLISFLVHISEILLLYRVLLLEFVEHQDYT